MIDLSLNTNQVIIGIVIVVYIVLISISISNYHEHLAYMKKEVAKFKLQLISKTTAQNSIQFELQQIKILKKKSYGSIAVIGFLHFLICLAIHTNLLSFGIPFVLFTFVLAINYWLKGSSVSSFIQNIPGQSDYHG